MSEPQNNTADRTDRLIAAENSETDRQDASRHSQSTRSMKTKLTDRIHDDVINR